MTIYAIDDVGATSPLIVVSAECGSLVVVEVNSERVAPVLELSVVSVALLDAADVLDSVVVVDVCDVSVVTGLLYGAASEQRSGLDWSQFSFTGMKHKLPSGCVKNPKHVSTVPLLQYDPYLLFRQSSNRRHASSQGEAYPVMNVPNRFRSERMISN